MKKRSIAFLLIVMLLSITGCGRTQSLKESNTTVKQRLISAVQDLPQSKTLYFKNGLTITGMGVNYSGNAVKNGDNYYFPAITQMTGVTLNIFWTSADSYQTSLSTTLLEGTDQLPDILNASDFGVMDLVDDGAVIPLDDYLDLMPDIVAAVGSERMDNWREADGHIYAFPSVTNVQGAQTMMVRKDWLDKLGLEEPQSWEEWLTLWRAIRDNDVNGNGDPNDEIPFASQYGDDGERCLLPLLNAFGIKVSGDTQYCLLDDGTYTMVYEHPQYKEFLKAMQQLYAEGLIPADLEQMQLEQMDAAMDEDRLGTTFNWAERCRTSAQTLRQNGVENAIWEAVAPITGPDGTQMTPERLMLTPIWCISAEAKKNGKVEDIVRFFNWCYTQEGSWLYSYGLPGISYNLKDDVPIMIPEITENGFTSYRDAGCNIESFGGLWQEGAFTQCLFKGKSQKEMDDMTREFYKGIKVVNEDYFYTLPKTLETPAYTQYHIPLIQEGVCKLRDKAIRGEITSETFFSGYTDLKHKGLNKVLTEDNPAP